MGHAHHRDWPAEGILDQASPSGKPLRAWYAEASRANWANPADINAAHRDASFIGNKRVIFNIRGNDYRLVVALHFDKRRMFIRFVGTHGEYDKIDAATI